MTSHIARISLLLASLALVAGCSKARSSLGLGRQSPDEFSVVRQAPLSMPPAFNLSQPKPGLTRPQEVTPQEDARTLVMGKTEEGEPSSGETAFLALAGTEKADANIRALVDRETSGLLIADKNAIDKLIFWQQQDPPDPIVDAQKEAARLKTNAREGKPASTGEVPVIERKRKAIFENVFR